ncbi:MAG: bifunctional folylpolyglutamate synthase/dihydrofolate synthase [Candidatus Eisenbacteria bacterium]|uniref:tetrahydrofolate synthase n=1 Tax=Eiseniibacteriota bacterium TaxID=2212470 RepID=A0A538U992_UNCEI|nr:MAG: bifunctional folylpolyglutamate synthase/dihydrofolate synthase [Candidatus Eisenbacteria bacterium]
MSVGLQHALEALYGRERRRDKHDLIGITALLEAMGDPHRAFRSVHVAGTNGKGSVCALIERALRAAGLRTGLFTSPHLVDFRERIRVSGRWADEAALAQCLEGIGARPEGRDRTFFEVCTALAFATFAAQAVELAVVEVGLGGRLDCTNVITPEVTVITSIGLDHTEILGDTLAAIAGEKAGIIKPGVPVVLGAMPDEARRVIERVARERGAPLHLRGVAPAAAPAGSSPRPVLDLNRRTALAALDALASRGVPLPPQAVAEGLAAARWPGRLEPCPREPRLWWDGAHNPSGMGRLVDLWAGPSAPPRPSVVVLGLSVDKDADQVLRVLRGAFPQARLIATRSRSERALAPEALAARAAAAGFDVETLPDVPLAVARGLERAGEGIVLLTGSLFAVGEAMEAYGGAPGELL